MGSPEALEQTAFHPVGNQVPSAIFQYLLHLSMILCAATADSGQTVQSQDAPQGSLNSIHKKCKTFHMEFFKNLMPGTCKFYRANISFL